MGGVGPEIKTVFSCFWRSVRRFGGAGREAGTLDDELFAFPATSGRFGNR